jgi:hypothetical protein
VTTSKDNVKDMEKSTMEMGSSLTSETWKKDYLTDKDQFKRKEGWFKQVGWRVSTLIFYPSDPEESKSL